MVSDEKRVAHQSGFAHLFHFRDSNSAPALPPPSSQQMWDCGFCGHHENPLNLLQCRSCGLEKNFRPLADNEVPQSQQQRWDCLVCTYSGNHWDASHCAICSYLKGSPSIQPATPHCTSESSSSPSIAPPATKSASPASSNTIPNDDLDRTCIICFTNPRSHLFMPCFHLVTCATCIHDFSLQTPCPVCRTAIGDIKQVYFA